MVKHSYKLMDYLVPWQLPLFKTSSGTPKLTDIAVTKTDTTSAIGMAKEELACQYLQAQGLKLLARNVRYRSGELDIVMQDDKYLVFIEVRYRRNRNYGTAQESVNLAKQRHIRLAARQYLQKHPSRFPCRFDVLAITENTHIEWIQDAFQDA